MKFGRTLQTATDRIRKRLSLYNDYDHTIPPEIKDDEFYEVIRDLASRAEVKTILEIGSSNGEGSTTAFVTGLRQNANRPTLYCIELSRPRFEALVARYGDDPHVRCFNITSVPIDRYPTEQDITNFYRTRKSKMNRIPLREVLRWWRQDVQYLNRMGQGQRGIQEIKDENGIDTFGIVLIDGSEFTGAAELDEVYGADHILLDDIGTFKNFANFERLQGDPTYRLTATNPELRNGYAVFERQPHRA
jgi:hypothetical protein